MPSAPQLIYWDSCVVIAYLSSETERVSTLEAILERVNKSDGKVKIVISQIAKVEVSFVTAERTNKTLSAEVEKKIDDFWADESILQLVEFHDGIASLARQLIRDGIPKGWRLKPMDAVHLATAKYLEVAEFHTYNLQDFQRYAQSIGLTIGEPYIAQPKMF